MKGRRKLAIVVIPDWGPEPRSVEIPWRWARLLIGLAVVLALTTVLVSVAWTSMARRAAVSDALRTERDALVARQDSMEMLAARLASLEARETQLRTLSGLEGNRDSVLWLSGAARNMRGVQGAGANVADEMPTMWPLTERGFVTQSLLEGDDGRHPGIDIAIASGSYVKAAGSGQVIEAAEDSVYGRFVLIDHGNGFWSRYGHAVYLSVTRGQRVRRGEVIALSGSTGRSTAPHLHFEIITSGGTVDPLSMVTPP